MKSFNSVILTTTLALAGSGWLNAQQLPTTPAPATPTTPALVPVQQLADGDLPDPPPVAPYPAIKRRFAQTAREIDTLKSRLSGLAQTEFAAAQEAAQRAQETAANAFQEAQVAWAETPGLPGMARVFTKDAGRGKSLIIVSSDIDRKEMTEMDEDLAVMTRILEKAAARKSTKKPTAKTTAMGIYIHNDVFSSQPVQNMYLDGYGALFFLNVKFPLVAPAQKKEEAKTEVDEDSDWNQTRKELYGRSEGDFFLKGFGSGFNQPAEEYDADKVDKLKTALLEGLKNGANIRHLKPEEFITINVSGPANVTAMRTAHGARAGVGHGVGSASASTEDDDDATFSYTYTVGGDPGMRTAGPGTMLTIRVKKADADAYAKDKIKSDEFRAKAKVQTYTSTSTSGASRASARTIVKDRLMQAPVATPAPRVAPVPKIER